MANHIRSNSLPSKSHPLMQNVEYHLCRLRASDSSVCSSLASLKDLHETINDVIQLPGIQQALSQEQGKNWADELLDGSLRLLDSCGIARDVTFIVKESVQELESSLRRSRGETVVGHDVDAYMASRKRVTKTVKKCIKNFKGLEQSSPVDVLNMDQDLKTITSTLVEAEAIGFSVLKSVLMLLSGVKASSKSRTWSLVSKFTQSKRVHLEMEQRDVNTLNIHKNLNGMDAASVPDFLNQLKESEMTIQEIEGGLESFFRSLVKTRVSLLNVLSH
ncbi:UNVERIFIED_CONTAM: hypothetical protein Slati_2565100 [Sesamum latifolium]|uniref:DUF241 domain protein n=1 Tax=Sesamum latifolium TaxID=2727402 RepID=A0AAW2VSD4_9LAMI